MYCTLSCRFCHGKTRNIKTDLNKLKLRKYTRSLASLVVIFKNKTILRQDSKSSDTYGMFIHLMLSYKLFKS